MRKLHIFILMMPLETGLPESPRANIQVNKLNKAAGYNLFEARVVEVDIPNRELALEWEKIMHCVYGRRVIQCLCIKGRNLGNRKDNEYVVT